MLFVAESLKGSHSRGIPRGAELLSTRGSAAITFNKNSMSYSVAKGLIEYAKASKSRVAFIGTDLDAIGTKVATVISSALQNEGIETVRYALTEKGYMKVGRFYTSKEMQAFASLDKANIETAHFFSKKFTNLPFKVGLARAVVIGAVANCGDRKNFPVKMKGTSTATAVTKGVLSGYSVSEMVSKLSGYYSSGLIEYPRVDNDYIEEGYDVYAHPPLPSKGFENELLTPFEVEELPLNKDTIIMFLSQERLITPSMLNSYYNTIDVVFDDNLKPREEMKKLVSECSAVYRELAAFYKETQKTIHPRTPLIKVPTPETYAKKKKKKTKQVIDEWLEKVKKKLKKELEELEELNKQRLKFAEEKPLPELPEFLSGKSKKQHLEINHINH